MKIRSDFVNRPVIYFVKMLLKGGEKAKKWCCGVFSQKKGEKIVENKKSVYICTRF